MARTAIRIGISLILGMITSVAIAWACALWMPAPNYTFVSDAPWKDRLRAAHLDIPMPVAERAGIGIQHHLLDTEPWRGDEASRQDWQAAGVSSAHAPWGSIEFTTAGWPWPALEGTRERAPSTIQFLQRDMIEPPFGIGLRTRPADEGPHARPAREHSHLCDHVVVVAARARRDRTPAPPTRRPLREVRV